MSTSRKVYFGLAATTTGLVALQFFLAGIGIFIAASVLAGAAYAASRRTQQHALQRARLTLEQVLDRLELGDAEPPSLIKLIGAALPPPR